MSRTILRPGQPRTREAARPVLAIVPNNDDCTEWIAVESDNVRPATKSVNVLTPATTIETFGEEVSRFDRSFRRRLPSFPPEAA
jgi:hypothetical protein